MGIFTKLFGGTEGIREAMRESYEKHYKLAQVHEFPGLTPHEAGLLGALGTRYKAWGKKVSEQLLWIELTPFLMMEERQAVEALAEYVVFKEYPKRARTLWLLRCLNSAIMSCEDTDLVASIILGLAHEVPWVALLEKQTLDKIDQLALELSQQP